MRIMRLGPLFAFSFLFSVSAMQAQQSPPPAPRDAQAVLMLQRSLAALTGTATVNDVTLTGTATRIAGSDNESGTATLKATAVGQGRVDLSLSSGQRSEVADISQAPAIGSWAGPDGTWHSVAAHNLFSDPTWFFPTFLVHRVLSASNYAISPMDADTVDGVPVDHLSVYEQSGLPPAVLIQGLSQIDIYLNPSTLLPVAISFNTHPDDDALVNIPTQIKFSSYQTLQGGLVPYRIQKYIQNSLVLDMTVSGVQINTGLSGSDFQAQ